MANHFKTSHKNCNIKAFKCELSYYLNFSAKRNLNIHTKNKHDSNRIEYKCQLCDSKYFEKRNLKSHILKIHEKKTPFKCNQCDKAYSKQNCFKRHIKDIHDGRYKMKSTELCDKHFTQKTHLRTQKQRHPHCEPYRQSFTQQALLDKHLKENHTV